MASTTPSIQVVTTYCDEPVNTPLEAVAWRSRRYEAAVETSRRLRGQKLIRYRAYDSVLLFEFSNHDTLIVRADHGRASWDVVRTNAVPQQNDGVLPDEIIMLWPYMGQEPDMEPEPSIESVRWNRRTALESRLQLEFLELYATDYFVYLYFPRSNPLSISVCDIVYDGRRPILYWDDSDP